MTRPDDYGIDAPAFDVVIPSLPGYGFSQRPAQVNDRSVARMWHMLMHMALEHPASMIGFHLTTM